MPEARCERYVARGRVQGVGYRDRVRRAAVARGLNGWVRNRSDGSVEIVVQGPATDIAAWLREVSGPRGSSDARRVELIETLAVDPALSSFEIDF
jgi:acylphosphatase